MSENFKIDFMMFNKKERFIRSFFYNFSFVFNITPIIYRGGGGVNLNGNKKVLFWLAKQEQYKKADFFIVDKFYLIMIKILYYNFTLLNLQFVRQNAKIRHTKVSI